MRSEFRRLLAAAMLTIVGCTEQLPIEPVFTSDDDWTPTFEVTWYGYQRIALKIQGPPRKELVPNIAQYVLSVREVSDTVLIPIDTLEYVAPSYVEPSNHNTEGWQTEARVPYGKAYYPFVSVHYRNGTVRRQGGMYLAPDMGRGTILGRFPIGTAAGGSYPQLGDRVAVWRSQPLFNRDERLYLLDTASGTWTQLTTLLPPPTGPGTTDPHRLMGLGVDGDTLVALMQIANEHRIKVVKINLNTYAADTAIGFSFDPAHNVVGAAAASGRFGVLYFLPTGQRQIVLYDSRSGATVQTYPAGVLTDDGYDRFLYDGTDFWIQSWQYQETPAAFLPIKRLDPATMSFTLVHRNPVEDARTMAFDHPYAWMEDHSGGSYTLVKVRLEGF